MRSAVSAILSEPSEASSMAFPDYVQTSADHRRGLVLILSVGSRLPSAHFHRVRDRIEAVSKVSVPAGAAREPGGPDPNPDAPPRVFRVRHLQVHPVENNEWGDFQLHRALIGVVCVGGYGTPQELCELSRLHDVARAKYGKTVLDSRLIAIGLSDQNGSDLVDHAEDNPGDHDIKKLNGDDLELPPLDTSAGGGGRQLNSLGSSQPSSNQQSTVLFYQNKDYDDTLEADMTDFVTGLFWILESKRRDLQKSMSNGFDKMPFLCAPFEKKDFVGIDLESRTNKKRTYGRHRKHMGDLSLICDKPLEALAHYESSAEILRSCNDWIWLAGALEGLCSIAVMALYPNLNKRTLIASRNPSYDTFSNFKKKRSIESGTEQPLLLPPSKVLKANDIIDKYKECVVHYSKYRHAGVIETEASIKAVRVLTEQCNYLLAAEFLQNIVFINLQMNDEEKIQRFSALAKLYEEIGFKRKAAFFLRVAAMRCVAPQNPHPDWNLCYSLLIKATYGYYLDLTDTVALKRRYIGWPALQIQLLQEMVGTSRRMGHHAASTRHMTYLLEVLFDHLSDAEKTDFSQQLSVLTSRNVDTTAPISLDSLGGLILPPVPMYKVPKISSFSLVPMASHLAPRKKIGHRKNKESVFVFTPINFGAREDSLKNKVNFQWVANDVAEVCLTLFNPLPTEVKIVNLALLHEGIEFETLPSTLSLSPNSGPHTVSLLGVPKDAGELKILGYTFNVLGVQSTCRLRGSKGQVTDYTISVLPSLPQVDASLKQVLEIQDQVEEQGGDNNDQDEAGEENPVKKTPARKLSKSVKSEEVLRLYHGESVNYELFFTNISNIKAENVKVSCSANPRDMNDMVTLSGSGLDEAGITLDPGESSSVQVKIEATRLLFNNSIIVQDDNDLASIESNSRKASALMPSRQDPNRWSNMSRETDSASNSAKRPTLVTLDFKVSYSGGLGGEQGYHRELVKPLKVDITPSALVTKWDVLPAEIVNENYLVLDLLNQTIHEMDITYGPTNKTLSIEPDDVCRIPVPIAKFDRPESSESKNNSIGRPPPQGSSSRQKACTDHLQKSIQIKWRLPRLNGRSGLVSMRDITLSDDMISSLERCPLQWSVQVNGQAFVEAAGEPLAVSVGAEVKLDLGVKSNFDFDLTGHFSVEVKEAGNSEGSSDLLVVQSQPESGILDCSPGAKIGHKTAILPLSTGTYDVIVACSIVKKTQKSSTASAPSTGDVFSLVSKYPKIVINVSEAASTSSK